MKKYNYIFALLLVFIFLVVSSTSAVTNTAATGTVSWNSTTTWSQGHIPLSTEDVVIPTGANVSMNTTAAVCNTMSITGTVVLLTGGTCSLTVTADITINSGGVLQTSASGTSTSAIVSLGGNLANAGSLNLAAGDKATLTFTGAASNTFSGAGTTTNIYKMIINKGTSAANILTLSTSVFTVAGVSTGADTWLTLTNGMLKVSGTFTFSGRIFGTGSYSIVATAGFWLNNANFTVAANAGTYTLAGTLHISAGTFNNGTTSGNSTTYSSGAVFTMDGGAFNVAGRFAGTSTAQTITFNMSAGTLTVNTVANTSASYASFDIPATGSSFTMSGGTIILQKMATGATQLDYRNIASTTSITGGTVQFGNSLTGASATFLIGTAAGTINNIPNVIVDAATNTKTVKLNTDCNNYGNFTINSGCTFDANGNILYLYGLSSSVKGTLENHGSIIGSTGSTIRFYGANGQQTYLAAESGTFGTSASPFPTIVCNNGSGLLITNNTSPVIQYPIVVTTFSLWRGTITNSANITLGNGTAGTVNVGNSANYTPGKFDVVPNFNCGSGNTGLSIYYANMPTVGFVMGNSNEMPVSRTALNLLTINSYRGVVLSGGDLTVSTLKFNFGCLSLGNNNLTVINPCTTGTDIGYAITNGTGKLILSFPSAVQETCPLGGASGYAGANTNSLSTSVTNLSNITNIAVGMKVVGTGIPANTYITAVTPTTITPITISNAATATNTNVYLSFCDYSPLSFTTSGASQNYSCSLYSVTPPIGGSLKQWFIQESNPGTTSFTSLSLNWNEFDLGNLPATGTCDLVCNTSGSSTNYDVLQSGLSISTGTCYLGDDSIKASSFVNQPGDISGGLYISVVQSNSALPVELSSFISTVNGTSVCLNWETKTEKNSDRFQIERSQSINNNWINIGNVKASCLSNSPKQYAFTEQNLKPGKYLYRLKMIDNDGTFEYSQIIESVISVPGKFELSQNYPNPFNPSTKINYQLPGDSRVTLEIFDITGKRIAEVVNQDQAAGYYTFNFQPNSYGSNLSSGVYIYRINVVDKISGVKHSSSNKMTILK